MAFLGASAPLIEGLPRYAGPSGSHASKTVTYHIRLMPTDEQRLLVTLIAHTACAWSVSLRCAYRNGIIRGLESLIVVMRVFGDKTKSRIRNDLCKERTMQCEIYRSLRSRAAELAGSGFICPCEAPMSLHACLPAHPSHLRADLTATYLSSRTAASNSDDASLRFPLVVRSLSRWVLRRTAKGAKLRCL